MYSETIFISKIVACSRVLENKDCGFGPRKIDLKDPGFLLFTTSSEYETYALTECHSGKGLLARAARSKPRSTDQADRRPVPHTVTARVVSERRSSLGQRS